MTSKNPLLLMIALSTAVACDNKVPADETGSNSEPAQDDTGDQNSDDTRDEGDDTGDGGDDTDDEGDDTGDGGDDTGDGGDDTGEISDVQAPPTPDAFTALAIDARDAQIQVFSVLASDWNYIEATQGSTLFFWPNSFSTPGGAVATGEVQIEFIEIFDKGSMLVTDMPSIGQLPSGEVAQLISGGEHYVGATKDGEALTLSGNFQLTAPVDNTGGADFDMTLFKAEVTDGVAADLDDQAVWVEQDGTAEEGGLEIIRGDGGGGDGGGGEFADTYYSMISSEFGWSNIDRWYSDPRPKTIINVAVPDGWDDTNSTVYLSYDGEPTALARMDTFDDATQLFSEHYGLIPIGLEVHLIFVTESEGDWSYAIQGTTIVDGHLTTFASADDFIETDTDGLVDAINALP
jgi:hypothetical protein